MLYPSLPLMNLSMFLSFLLSGNYKCCTNVECQFSFVKLKYLNKFQGTWGCILNWVTHNSAAGDEGNALITKFRAVALGLCCTSESFGN